MINSKHFKLLSFLLLLFLCQSCGKHRLNMGTRAKRSADNKFVLKNKKTKIDERENTDINNNNNNEEEIHDSKLIAFTKWTPAMFYEKFKIEFDESSLGYLDLKKIISNNKNGIDQDTYNRPVA